MPAGEDLRLLHLGQQRLQCGLAGRLDEHTTQVEQEHAGIGHLSGV
jgi:hypothetical protein